MQRASRVPEAPRHTARIMLDSGAYSAWTRGGTIKVGDYIDFIRRHRDRLDTYINLDVIPGSKGVRPTLREVDHAAAASFDNYEVMRAAGLSPIPVFHYGESFSWLERLVAAGADYIALGGTVGVPTGRKREFLDECFAILTDAAGAPVIKVHGLGVTDSAALARYPWHSADSTSWMIAPIYGAILVPHAGSMGMQVNLGKFGVNAYHQVFEEMPPRLQQHVVNFIEECGFTITDVRNDVHSRTAIFVSALLKMQSSVPKKFMYRRPKFGRVSALSGLRAADLDFRIAGSQSNVHRREVVHRCGAHHFLRYPPYWEHRKDPDGFDEYVDKLESAQDYDPSRRTPAKVDWDSLNYRDHRRRLVARRGGMEAAE